MPTTTDDRLSGTIAAYSEHTDAYAEHSIGLATAQFDRFVAGLSVDDVILDAGCGPGRDLVRFAEAGHCAVGVDLTPEFVDMAAEITDGWPVHVHLGDLRSLDMFHDDEFAAIWACASLVHLDRADAATALAELHRVARPGAPLYVSVKHGSGAGWFDTIHGRRWYQMWSVDEFAAAVSAAGFAAADAAIDAAFVDCWATA